jgi:hypothetical protein
MKWSCLVERGWAASEEGERESNKELIHIIVRPLRYGQSVPSTMRHKTVCSGIKELVQFYPGLLDRHLGKLVGLQFPRLSPLLLTFELLYLMSIEHRMARRKVILYLLDLRSSKFI